MNAHPCLLTISTLFVCILYAAENGFQRLTILNGTKSPLYLVLRKENRSVVFNGTNTVCFSRYRVLLDSSTQPSTHILELRPNAEDLENRRDTVIFFLYDGLRTKKTRVSFYQKTNLSTQTNIDLTRLTSYSIMPSFGKVHLLVLDTPNGNPLEITYPR